MFAALSSNQGGIHITRYRCDICTVYEYDTERGDSVTNIRPHTKPEDFPDDWACPICNSKKTELKRIDTAFEHPDASDIRSYLGIWRRKSDDTEAAMELIHRISETRESISEPMRSKKYVPSWDDIFILGAQLAKIPVNSSEDVVTRTVIGPGAKVPLVIDTPVFITHMSFGALSREMKIVLAQGSAAVKTAIGSGEGGILIEERQAAYKYIFEYVPNRYSVSDENLRAVDAVEIKIGQSAKPGMGGEVPAEKATPEIAAIRGFPEGTDIISPARFDDIRNGKELREKVEWLREKSGGKPIGIKLAAGKIEADLQVAVGAGPDFITIDGRPGGTAAANKMIKDSTSVPTIFALHRARKYLDENNAGRISLVITGGLRISSDFAKAIAMGADAVAIGTAAMMATACQQYRLCNTDKCPVGVTTHNPELRERLKIRISTRKLENFLKVSTEELKSFARLAGYTNVHDLCIEDLCTINSEISGHTDIRHA